MRNSSTSFVVLFLGLLLGLCNGDCMIGEPTARDLILCTEYSASSCCTVEQEGSIIAALQQFEQVYGNSGCMENYANLSCALGCSPNQTDITSLDFMASSIVGYVALEYATGWFESCKNVCLTDDGKTVDDLFTNVADFVSSFDTANNPDYTPSIPSSPGLILEIRATNSYDGTPAEQLNELPGCPNTTFWTANGASATGSSDSATGSSDSEEPSTTSEPDDRTCPLKANQAPSPADIDFCTQYEDDACCFALGDEQLQTNLVSKLQPLYGEGNCFENIKRLMCAWTCGPFQGDIMTTTGSLILNVTVFVDAEFATALRDSCASVCLPFGGGITVAQQFPTGPQFVFQFDSSNDPSYVVDELHPNLKYTIGLSPNSDNINADKITLLEDDAQGCNADDSGASFLVASLLFSLIALMVVALF